VALDESRLVAVDREGRVEPLPAPHRPYLPNIAAAPDGRRLAVGIESATEIGVWSYDLTRHTLTRVSPTGGEHTSPAWTPDGTRISFVLIAGGRLTLGWQQADGAAPLATLAPDAVPRAMELGACTWSRDGRHLVYVMVGKQRQLLDLDLTSDPARSRPVLQTSSSEQWPALSADGRWLAYSSVATGRYEVYVQPFPGPGARVQVSLEGGDSPAWNPNGREIFFIESDPSSLRRRMMAVDFAPGTNAELATPRRLFEFDASDLQAACQMMTCYAVSSDGRRFYTTQSVKAEPPPPVTRIDLILNWRAELEAKVPSRR
jgi:Tol biopolymer transport system component